MLLAVDIGNSSSKFGIFGDNLLKSKFSIPTVHGQTADELYSQIVSKLDAEISAFVVSTVVPELKNPYIELSKNYFHTEPVFVDSTFDFGLEIRYCPRENLGADRIVAAFAGAQKYGKPCLVCDFGTATTIDAVNSNGEYLGGIITPGINTLADALFTNTATLPRVELEKPEKIIGNSTVSSIQAGIFYGYIGLVEGILRRMLEETGENPRIIATGGFAELISENCPLIEITDENLMLDGLNLLYRKTRN